MSGAWWTAAGFGVIALAGAWGERRRVRRNDPDRVGWVDWPTVQVLALVGMAIAVSVALNA